MNLDTRLFGKIEFDDNRTIAFPRGLVGFANMKRFLVIEDDALAPFRWLQCIDVPSVAFAVIPPLIFRPDYRVPISADEADDIGYHPGDDILVLAVSALAREAENITANLQGPLVVNSRTMQGIQVVLSSRAHGVREPICRELENVEGHVALLSDCVRQDAVVVG